jgi:predicted nuclease with RNAse H fold
MKVLGIDVTSRPSRKKPLVIASGEFRHGRLCIEEISCQSSFSGFEDLLVSRSPWVAGVDAPLSFPSGFCDYLGTSDWRDCCRRVRSLGRKGFEEAVYAYRPTLRKGQSLPLRECDRRAGAKSPLLLAYVPVGKMAYEVMSRLYRAECRVVPFERPLRGRGVVLETYPALITRRFIPGRKYKHEGWKTPDAPCLAAREDLVKALGEHPFSDYFGFSVTMTGPAEEMCVEDVQGDVLDAVLCAATAAWGYSMRREGYGVPCGPGSAEGWIVSPDFFQGTVLAGGMAGTGPA